mmetsp:Transcript_39072/g.51105  ORF Transcript_39072/g.51105 Transcript_39072/m.51105 type:complete len:243 (+) Transcript_39072:1453-2181(+)
MVYKEIIGDDKLEKQRENFRLRAFNVQYKIMLDTYTGRENQTLQQLKIYPMKTLAFEEKLPSESFEDYDPNSMLIKVNFWRSGIEALTEEELLPIEVKVRKDMHMSDLLVLLAEQNAKLTKKEWKSTDVIVLKRNPLLNTSHLEVLSEKLEKQLSQLRINEGVNLFVENKTELHPQGLGLDAGDADVTMQSADCGTTQAAKWEIEHELDGLRFQIKFNSPLDENAKVNIPETAITAQQILDC